MKWYQFHQNNSGGSFIAPAINVHIEVPTAEKANAIAQCEGLYFDGCEDGRDCECCGDRWYPCGESDAQPVASHYSTPLSNIDRDKIDKSDTEWAKEAGITLHLLIYADGSKGEMP